MSEEIIIRDPDAPATGQQVRAVYGIGKAKGFDTPRRLGALISAHVPGKADPAKLSKGEASRVIDALKALPDPPAQPGLFEDAR